MFIILTVYMFHINTSASVTKVPIIKKKIWVDLIWFDSRDFPEIDVHCTLVSQRWGRGLAKMGFVGQRQRRLPPFSHIYTFMAEQLHLLPLSDRIQIKVLLLFLKAQRCLVPKYLSDRILHPIFVTSLRPLQSSDRLNLFVSRVRT